MKKDFFKAEDFCPMFASHPAVDTRGIAAAIANAKLNTEIEKWPVVYGSVKRPLDGWNEKIYESTTHKGRLAFIEELPKKPCKHEISVYEGWYHGEPIPYKPCGVDLIAEWKEKK